MAGKMTKAAAKSKAAAKAGGKLAKGQTGIFRHLATEHGEVASLMKRVARTSETSKVREELFPEIRASLLAHAKAEEKVFYPGLRGVPGMAPLLAKSKQQHERVEELLGELDEKNKATKTWLTVFERMQRAVETHVELEEKEMFPLADEHLDSGEAKRLLAQYEPVEKHLKERLS